MRRLTLVTIAAVEITGIMSTFFQLDSFPSAANHGYQHRRLRAILQHRIARSLASPRVEPNHWRTLYRLTVPDSINCDEYFEITPKQIHFPNCFFSLCDMNYRYCFRPSKPHSPNIFKHPYNANNALTASRQYFAFALSLASLNYSLYTY